MERWERPLDRGERQRILKVSRLHDVCTFNVIHSLLGDFLIGTQCVSCASHHCCRLTIDLKDCHEAHFVVRLV